MCAHARVWRGYSPLAVVVPHVVPVELRMIDAKELEQLLKSVVLPAVRRSHVGCALSSCWRHHKNSKTALFVLNLDTATVCVAWRGRYHTHTQNVWSIHRGLSTTLAWPSHRLRALEAGTRRCLQTERSRKWQQVISCRVTDADDCDSSYRLIIDL